MIKITKDIMIYTLLGAILALVLIFSFAFKDGDQCLSNPLVYGAEKGSQSSGGDLFCTCTFANPDYYPIHFNKENMTVLPPLV